MIYLLIGIKTVLIIGCILIFLRLALDFYIMVQGAFYAGSSDKRIKNILKLADIKKGGKIVDLGSGDGRVLIACAKKGAICSGYEIDPLLIWKSTRIIKKERLDHKITIYPKSLWKADVSIFDVIIVYGIKHIMSRLEKKLKNEAKKGARIISVYFQFPNWIENERIDDVRLYKR